MPPAIPAAPTQNQFSTLTLATCNVMNLANPNRQFYPNQDAYSHAEYERKVAWLGERFKALNVDVLTVQEVWDEAALKAAFTRSGLHYSTVTVPGAENSPTPPGATGAKGTPCVGLITRLAVDSVASFKAFAPGLAVQVPGVGLHSAFERSPLLATLHTKDGHTLHVLTAHLKSKRPKFLQDANGAPQEDRDDPKIQALATLRSLIMRGAEATALRCIVVDVLRNTREPLVAMGDFNDGPHSVTTQIVAATSEIAYNKASRDVALFNAYEVQGDAALKKDVAYSHIHQGYPEVLDQILVSEEYVSSSRFNAGDVRRVDYFNDHLHEGRDRSRSDHGFVRALIRLKSTQLNSLLPAR
jgi:endonuclease/exonuclease/phosphatase family metal-dependent hydrolase